MSKRQFIVLAAGLVAVAALWALSTTKKPANDEARYQEWRRYIDWYARLEFVERHPPTGLAKFLHLPARRQRYLDKHEEVGEALQASGYLTNVDIGVTNASASRTQIADRLRKATRENQAPWEFSVRSNAVVVLTCRPKDVALCTRAIESK